MTSTGDRATSIVCISTRSLSHRKRQQCRESRTLMCVTSGENTLTIEYWSELTPSNWNGSFNQGTASKWMLVWHWDYLCPLSLIGLTYNRRISNSSHHFVSDSSCGCSARHITERIQSHRSNSIMAPTIIQKKKSSITLALIFSFLRSLIWWFQTWYFKRCFEKRALLFITLRDVPLLAPLHQTDFCPGIQLNSFISLPPF